jgi:carboxyl-terminal processing protease
MKSTGILNNTGIIKRIHITVITVLVLLWTGSMEAQWSPQSLKLAQVLDKVNRFYVDSINEEEVVERTITEMLHDLDPHSSYLSREELELLNEQLEGEFEGIGVSFNILEDTIYIVRAISGGPSEQVGIRGGDRIIKVNGEVVAGTGITTRDVQRLLKGPKGTRVNVTVLRRGMDELLQFTITRDKIPVYSLDASYMVNDRIGYVKLARFSHTTIDEFEIAVKELKAKGMKDLILDLSGNGGGWLPVAVDLADHFLSGSKEIVSTDGRTTSRKYQAGKEGLFEEGQLVIMIDRNSASASEIVSGAVQDWDRGILVGRRSFGKGLVQQPFGLSDGSMIRLTVARYYTPTGRLIQKPYDDGYEEYTMDLINRYNRGELNSSDSIVFPESQRFKTLVLHRTVYGGGGIMPDYFVPMDTSEYTDYYRQLINLGILNQFTLQYLDQHRDSYLEKYPDFETYRDSYEPSQEQMEELIEFAGEEGLEFNEAQWQVSKRQVKMLFKGYVARDLWGTGSFYEIYNPSNEVYKKAVEILKDPALLFQKLAKADN